MAEPPLPPLLEAPGNDAVSGTALAAAGATLLLFTTGRGRYPARVCERELAIWKTGVTL